MPARAYIGLASTADVAAFIRRFAAIMERLAGAKQREACNFVRLPSRATATDKVDGHDRLSAYCTNLKPLDANGACKNMPALQAYLQRRAFTEQAKLGHVCMY